MCSKVFFEEEEKKLAEVDVGCVTLSFGSLMDV